MIKNWQKEFVHRRNNYILRFFLTKNCVILTYLTFWRKGQNCPHMSLLASWAAFTRFKAHKSKCVRKENMRFIGKNWRSQCFAVNEIDRFLRPLSTDFISFTFIIHFHFILLNSYVKQRKEGTGKPHTWRASQQQRI